MQRRRVRIRGGGHIRIDRGWLTSPRNRPESSERQNRPQEEVKEDATGQYSAVSLGAGVLERAEIITEGVFRPGVADVEVKYVLSGKRRDRTDRLHPLASERIISSATPVSVSTNVSQMIELLKRSGAGDSTLIIDVHTHPSSSIASPSDVDKSTWRNVTQMLSAAFPGTRLLFGVHGVGGQFPAFVERRSPSRKGKNRLVWRSNTRNHEIALFAADSSPVEVRFDG